MRTLFAAVVLLFGCDVHEYSSMRVALPRSQYPVSMTDYIVVGTGILSRDQLDVVGVLQHSIACVPAATVADASDAINQQIYAVHGRGIIGFQMTVLEREKCQDITFRGEIVNVKGWH